MRKIKKDSLKVLSITALLGVVALGSSAEAANIDGLTPTLGENSTYTLKETETATDLSATLYDVQDVTKSFEYKDENGKTLVYNYITKETTPKYYNINLKNYEYGNGDNTAYYQWKNLITFEKVEVPEAGKPTITIQYNNLSEKFTNSADGTIEVIDGVYAGLTNAITNSGYIKGITADFIDNNGHIGGAIKNNTTGKIDYINSNFVGNHTTNQGSIINFGKVGEVHANFIGNYANNNAPLENWGTKAEMGNVTGDYIGNFGWKGGAIINREGAQMGNISGDFINNIVGNVGGAIYNTNWGNTNLNTTIGDITGNFIGNIVSYKYCQGNNGYSASGGALSNSGVSSNIGNISADFIGNYAENNYNDSRYIGASGGAIENYQGSIQNITGNFINSHVYNEGLASAGGGAIYNRGKSSIGNITGDFVENWAESTQGTTYGGAILNMDASIKDINSDFINNYAKSSAENVGGGAILNVNGNIGNITGDFVGNYIETNYNASGYLGATGGAIYNSSSSTIGNINGNFINNYAYNDEAASVYGGAIYNSSSSTIGNINGNFINNYAYNDEAASVYGGAIYNRISSQIGDITGDFIGNWAKSCKHVARGGAILNMDASIGNIKGDFIGNHTIGIDDGGFQSSGGAIYSSKSTIDNITGNFVDNYVEAGNAIGGAISNSNSTIGDIKGDFVNNHILSKLANGRGGAIWNNSKIGDITGSFSKNYVQSNTDYAYGGAIYNKGTIGKTDTDGNVTGGLVNANFIGNYAKGATEAKGGAIYTNTDLNLIADGHQNVISGNYTESAGVRDDNAIYLDSADATLSFDIKNKGSVVLKDNVNGVQGYGLNISGDNINNTTFYLHNDLYNANLALKNTTINTVDNKIHVYNVNKFTLNGDTKLNLDIDLANETIDRFTANEYGSHKGNLIVNGVNAITTSSKDKLAIYFAQPGLKNNVKVSANTEVYTPIFKYNLTYDNKNQYNGLGDGGYFVLNASNGSSGGANYNPAVLVNPVTSQSANNATMTETFKYVFEHADAFTQLSSMDRISAIKYNKFASTDFNGNIDLYGDNLNKGSWVRPYTSFESMNLKNGPKVNLTIYGTLVGYDTNFRELKHGWTNVGTGYIGYNGSQSSFNGTSTTANGGLLGFTETFYNGNFWTALTASAGASVAETHTMYGKEDSTSLLAGIASKSGYNFEFKEGKFILQPIWFMSYTFVNTFDYTNAAGVKISSDPMHSIQLNPSVRFIANTKKGWQPYASVGMVWNLMNETNAYANGVKLPEMSTKPYVEYGLGIQKRIKDHFTAFSQAMIRNGGRNGIALTAGFRWALGHENCKYDGVNEGVNEKVYQSQPVKKVLKQLTPTQKAGMSRRQNTTRTTNTGILKQL